MCQCLSPLPPPRQTARRRLTNESEQAARAIIRAFKWRPWKAAPKVSFFLGAAKLENYSIAQLLIQTDLHPQFSFCLRARFHPTTTFKVWFKSLSRKSRRWPRTWADCECGSLFSFRKSKTVGSFWISERNKSNDPMIDLLFSSHRSGNNFGVGIQVTTHLGSYLKRPNKLTKTFV